MAYDTADSASSDGSCASICDDVVYMYEPPEHHLPLYDVDTDTFSGDAIGCVTADWVGHLGACCAHFDRCMVFGVDNAGIAWANGSGTDDGSCHGATSADVDNVSHDIRSMAGYKQFVREVYNEVGKWDDVCGSMTVDVLDLKATDAVLYKESAACIKQAPLGKWVGDAHVHPEFRQLFELLRVHSEYFTRFTQKHAGAQVYMFSPRMH